MRKTFAVSMIAILSLMFALAVIGCAKKQTSETSTTPAEGTTPAPAESSSMMMDTTHHDTTGMKK